jgi:hypothetical protein
MSTLSVTFVGSLAALDPLSGATCVSASTRVCVLATAAAFRGPRESIEHVRDLLAVSGASVDGVDGVDRASANDVSVVQTVTSADLVVLVDGTVLHARSVWRDTALGDALATSRLIAVGSVGSVLGETMIDPRGGAPTTGLGCFGGVVVSIPAGTEQTVRTRNLLGDQFILIELGPRSVVTYDGQWRVNVSDDLVVTRGEETVSLSN